MILIWIQLLCLAGKQGNGGVFLISGQAVTTQMLAKFMGRQTAALHHALKVFERYGMIERTEGVITIPSWDRYQSLDAYERKKERDRIYQRKRYQERKARALAGFSADISPSLGVHEEEVEEEVEGEVEEKDDDVPIPDPLDAYALEHLPWLTPGQLTALGKYREKLPEEVIRWGIEQASANGARTYAYLRTILNSCVERGFRGMNDVMAAEERRKMRGGTQDGVHRGDFDEKPRRVFDGETVL